MHVNGKKWPDEGRWHYDAASIWIAVAWSQSHEQDKYEGGSGALEQRRYKKEEETETSRATSPLLGVMLLG